MRPLNPPLTHTISKTRTQYVTKGRGARQTKGFGSTPDSTAQSWSMDPLATRSWELNRPSRLTSAGITRVQKRSLTPVRGRCTPANIRPFFWDHTDAIFWFGLESSRGQRLEHMSYSSRTSSPPLPLQNRVAWNWRLVNFRLCLGVRTGTYSLDPSGSPQRM